MKLDGGIMSADKQEKRLSEQGVPIAETIPLVAVRKMIAEHMAKSHLTTSPVTLMQEIDVEELVKLKNTLGKESAGNQSTKITYTHIFIKVISQALAQHLILNSTLVGEEIHILGEINIGMAVSLPDGNLIVPVIRHADKKSIIEIANTCSELVMKAKSGKLTLEDVRGGTFTLTNIGMLPDCRWQTPLINQPQCAILAAGSIRQAPVVWNGQIVARWVLSVSLTFDHRIVNGLAAALFLKTLSKLLNEPSELDLGI
jgi:pyruvate dehydrogenase E2 component (dihydrolipoamide acetyltransferase)